MSFNHPVSDLVARIKNGYLANKSTVESPVSKLREAILKLLKEEGYILSFSKSKNDKGFEKFDIHLKYYLEKPVVTEIKVASKPGRRLYKSCDEIPVVSNGLGCVIISTSIGVITDNEAREKNVGGEILLTIF
jgi:small subunit ribosomal protein S8